MLKEKKDKVSNLDELNVEFETVKRAYFALRAMNHKLRQKMLLLIHKNNQLTVTEIYQKLKIEQSKTSMYLAILRKANLVIAERDGQNVYYRINYKQVSFLNKGAAVIIEGSLLQIRNKGI